MRYFLIFAMIVYCCIGFERTIYAQDGRMEIINTPSKIDYLSYLHSSESNTISSTSNEIMESFHPASLILEYAIQVGAFAKKNNAFILQRKLSQYGYRADVYEDYIQGKPLLYLVWVGSFNSINDAFTLWQEIRDVYKISGVVRMRSVTLHSLIKVSSLAVNQ
jgi:hypothetical protein